MSITVRKALVVGGTAAAIIGVGGTAMAVSGSDVVDGKSTTSSSDHSAAKHKKGDKGLLKRLEHGQFVTKTKKGTITHTIYRGSVTAVSPTSITVQAADKKTQTYTVDKSTKIREKAKGKKAETSSIGKIVKGDRVVVAGTGTSKVTAKQIVETAK